MMNWKLDKTLLHSNFAPLEATWHTVLTNDGYQLQMLRLSTPNTQSERPILLIHGCMMNCQAWYASNSPQSSIVHQLVQAGWTDIWLANGRGNRFSRGHSKFEATSTDYWSFTLENSAVADVEAYLRCISQSCDSKAAPHVIAFSQGTAMLLAYLSQKKLQWPIEKAALLAATALPGKSKTINWISQLDRTMLKEAFGNSNALLEESMTFLEHAFPRWLYAWTLKVCMRSLFGWTFANLKNASPDIWRQLYCTTSVALICNWFQIMQSNKFPWDISRIQGGENLAFFFGGKDSLSDAKYILKRIPQSCKHFIIQEYEHLDFLWSDNNNSTLFPHLLQHLSGGK